MKPNLFILLLLSAFMAACQKEHFSSDSQPAPKKNYILAGETGSDIYYHDINPDWDRYAYGLAGDSIKIDINNDSITDLSIKYSTVTSSYQYVAQTTVSCYNGTSVSVAPKNMNDTIDSSSTWTSSVTLLAFTKIDFSTNDTSFIGSWHSTLNKYMGVRVMKNGTPLYGWIRMSLLLHPATVYVQEVVVKDFGCRLTE